MGPGRVFACKIRRYQQILLTALTSGLLSLTLFSWSAEEPSLGLLSADKYLLVLIVYFLIGVGLTVILFLMMHGSGILGRQRHWRYVTGFFVTYTVLITGLLVSSCETPGPASTPSPDAADSGSSAAPGGQATADAGAPRPNVVFIITDDQRGDGMSCAGHPFLKTPNLDRLAKEGALFRRMFVTTSLCSPSRASFLSGLYAHSHKVVNNFTDYPVDLPSFPRRLSGGFVFFS